MNQFFEKPWPARCRMKPASRAWPGVKKTTASAAMHPFFVPPKDSTSTPAAGRSAGATPSAATALAKRAPSMCSARARLRATSESAAIFVRPVDGTELRNLCDAERRRLAAMRLPVLRDTRERRRDQLGPQLSRVSSDRKNLGPATKELGRSGLVDLDMGVRMGEDDAAGARVPPRAPAHSRPSRCLRGRRGPRVRKFPQNGRRRAG